MGEIINFDMEKVNYPEKIERKRVSNFSKSFRHFYKVRKRIDSIRVKEKEHEHEERI